MVNECINETVRIKKLPLSRGKDDGSFGRCTEWPSWGPIWTHIVKRNDGSSHWQNIHQGPHTVSLFSDTRLRHPDFYFHIKPLDLSVQIRQISTLLRLIDPLGKEISTKMLRSNAPNALQPPLPWRILKKALFDIMPLLGVPYQRANSSGLLDQG